MGKRKICRIVKYSTLATGVTSYAIGMLPYIMGEPNKTAAIVGTSICAVGFTASIISNNILYRINKREEFLDAQKQSDTYKKSLLNEKEKFESFGMYLVSKTRKLTEDEITEVFDDYDIEQEILEKKLALLDADEEEEIDYLYDRINYLSSFVEYDSYKKLKDDFYKKQEGTVVSFNKNKQTEKKSLKLINKKKKTSNDDKE